MTPAGRMNRSKQHNIRTEAHFVQSLPEGCSELDSVLRCSNYLPSWHPHKYHLQLRDILGSGISATFWDMKESGKVLETSQKFCFNDTLRFHYCFHFRSVLKEAELFQPWEVTSARCNQLRSSTGLEVVQIKQKGAQDRGGALDEPFAQ